jgi:hypothetical protein
MKSQIKKQSEPGYWKELIIYLPILTLISLGVGVLSLLVYYYPFHLDILTYTNINEILLGTAISLIKCIVLFLFTQAVGHVFAYQRVRVLKIVDSNDSRLMVKINLKTINIIMILVFTCLTILFILFLRLIEGVDFLGEDVGTDFRTIVIGTYIYSLLSSAFVLYFEPIYRRLYFKSVTFDYINIVFIGTFIIIHTIGFSLKDAVNARLLSTYGTYMTIGSKRIVSDENNYYIGRTRDFIFFYNAERNFTEIYQSKDVTLLSLNNKGFTKTKAQVSKILKDKKFILKQKRGTVTDKEIIDSVNQLISN